MAYDKIRLSQKVSFSFKTGALSNAIPVTCSVTGIVGTLNMPALPISFIWNHPLASIGNVRTLIKGAKDNNKDLRHILERQTLAGILLSLLNHNRLLAYEPEFTAAEKNLYLQSCGSNLLEKGIKFFNYLSHTPYIEDHWKGIRKIPQYSLKWATKDNASALSIAESFMSYCKTVRDHVDPERIEHDRILSMPMDFIKAKDFLEDSKSTVDANKRLRIVQNVKQEKRSLKDTKDKAKAIYEDLEPLLSRELQAMCKLVIRNLHLGISKNHADMLASKLLLLQNNDAAKLAGLIQSAVSKHLASEMGFFSDEVSPKPATSIAEIIARKRAANSGIVVEVMPRTEEEQNKMSEPQDFEDSLSDAVEDFETQEIEKDSDDDKTPDLLDIILEPSNPRTFKGEF